MTDRDNAQQFSLLKQIVQNTEFTARGLSDLNASLLSVVQQGKEQSKETSKKPLSGTIDIKDIVNAVKSYDTKAQKNSLKLIDFLTKFNTDVVEKVNVEKAEKFGVFISSVSSSMFKFSRNALFMTPMIAIGQIGVTMFAKSASMLLEVFAGYNEKQMAAAEAGVGVISLISSSMLGIAGRLVLALPLMVLAIPAALAAKLLVTMLIWSAKSMAELDAKNIQKGITALNGVAKSILFFAGALALAAIITIAVVSNPMGLLALVGAIGAFGFAFGMVGKFDKEIKKGSIAVLAMGASLLFFSATVALSAMLMAEVDPMSMLLLGGVLAGTALIYGIAGKFFKEILFGALSFAAIGISLMLLASPLESISKTVQENESFLWQLPVLLGELGLVFALAGIPAVALAMGIGAVAFGLVGGALWVLGKGIGSFLEYGTVTEEDANGIEMAIKAVVTGIGQSFEKLSWAQTLAFPLTTAAVGLAGLALIPLGQGIKAYKSLTDGWTDEDSDSLKYTIASITGAFATAGSTEGMSTLFGFNVGSNDTERGIESTMRMGRNLERLSNGIKSWKDMKLEPEDLQNIVDNVTRVLNIIPAIFADIGRKDRESGSSEPTSMMGMIFGADFSSSDTEAGIESTMKIGQNLKNLADGITAWKEMKLTPEELQPIADNIQRVLNVIPGIFASIGKREKGTNNDTSFLGMLIGTDFSDGDIKTGIESTEKLGKTLSDLAGGVIAWKDFDQSSLPTITKNITDILATIPKAFAEIGKAENETEGLFSGGDVSTGVDMMNELSPAVKDIAKLVGSFKDIPDPSIFGYKIGFGIKGLFKGIIEATRLIKDKDIDKLNKLVKPLDKLAKIFKTLNVETKKQFDYIGKLDKNYIANFTKWADALSKIGEAGQTFIEKGMGFGTDLTKQKLGDASGDANISAVKTAPSTKTVTSTDVTPASKKNPAAAKSIPAAANNQAMADIATALNSIATALSAQKSVLDQINTKLGGTLKTKETPIGN